VSTLCEPWATAGSGFCPIWSGLQPYRASGSARIARSGFSATPKKNQCHHLVANWPSPLESLDDRNAVKHTKAAKRLTRKLLKGQGHSPGVMITDKLRSYGGAKREIMLGVEHRSHKG
jgi:hypothetical protein